MKKGGGGARSPRAIGTEACWWLLITSTRFTLASENGPHWGSVQLSEVLETDG